MKIFKFLLALVFMGVLAVEVNAAVVKLENLPTETTPAAGDEVILTDVSASNDTNKITLTNFFATVPADIVVKGTTPSITIGDAGTEDTSLNFDGNAVDFHIALDDSDDSLEIGFGTTVETDERITINGSTTETIIEIGDAAEEDMQIVIDGNAVDFRMGIDDSADDFEIGLGGTFETTERITIDGSATETIITLHDATANDASIIIDGNAVDFHISLDDTADELEIGYGTTVETDERLTIGGGLTETVITIADGTAEDSSIVFDGIAQDYYIALDDSEDDLVIGLGSTVGTTPAIQIDQNQVVTMAKIPVLSLGATITTGAVTFADGGTITQITNKSTPVTLSTWSGQITTNNASLAAGAEVTFVVTNTNVTALDVVCISIASSPDGDSEVIAYVNRVASGAFDIVLSNLSGNADTGAIVINFVVLRGASS